MFSRQRWLALPASLLFSILASVNAVPSVNVALKTSFPAPPFLLELLETAADENSTSYFPLLDRIADGYFGGAKSNKELYELFKDLLQKDGHLVAAEDLSSFDLALSIHSAAPRIEAHYQYYNASISSLIGKDDKSGDCESWVYLPFVGKRWCSPQMDPSNAKDLGKDAFVPELPFDRVLGGESSDSQPTILYADVTSESFKNFHRTVRGTARDGKTSYRLRYKPAKDGQDKEALAVSGYGVELALKRTDYIVIDDRQAGENGSREDKGKRSPEATLKGEDEVSDLKPLTSKELLRLGLKAGSFVLASDEPFDVLAQLSQDFPKYSSAISTMEVSEDFLNEHRSNREVLLTPGFNVIWINGVQIMARDFDIYNMLEHLRRERKMINGVRELGLSAPQAVDLLSHESIVATQVSNEAQRYDWRDETEGGNVIIWLNDIEKDKRYEGWPDSIMALLQRTYPGQLPPVRRDIHNLVVPIDFANFADVKLVTESLRNFVQRQIPIRMGLVPYYKSAASEWQARTVYHLMETYGLSTTLDYLNNSTKAAGRRYSAPQAEVFEKVVAGRKVRKNREQKLLKEVLTSEDYGQRLRSARAYITRLASTDVLPPIFINGVPVTRTEGWLQAMSQRVGIDSRIVAQAVYQQQVFEADYLPDLFLIGTAPRRNPVIVPEDDKEIRHLNLASLPQFAELPSIPASPDTIEIELVHLTVAVDLDSKGGFATLMEALTFQKKHDNVELNVLHNPIKLDTSSKPLAHITAANARETLATLLSQFQAQASTSANQDDLGYDERKPIYDTLFNNFPKTSTKDEESNSVWSHFRPITSALGATAQQKALVLNGRIVGPIAADAVIEVEDFEALLAYERKQRLLPASAAIKGLGIETKAATPYAFAKISNLIALSTISDVPEGFFEAAPTLRTGIFKPWNSSHTAIKSGDFESANIQIYASIDPASEVAQRWIPILKTLSEQAGVYTCLFVNPKDRLEELPVKRFYRQVLESKPTFNDDGALRGLSAHFSGLPADALLNMGMDLPASWLVAPKDSVHDLDNIKLSATRGDGDIEAIYELEHILIEGHARDVTVGPPPRGAQLVLGTDADPHFEDTIIMANVGYFQFKANPGIYNLTLQKGRSHEIFHLDSAGTLGYAEQPGDETSQIALMSFRGATIFPRLSRKPGMEDEDVLDTEKSSVGGLASKADRVLVQVGLGAAQGYFSKVAKFGSGLLGGSDKGLDSSRHADINIFSVASGHLYERMLNIMMLSVMKHTKQSVKFWFIEQFLSPSFKEFLPALAKEYGFQYEMVTYKWPHWLRSQKEKQREIWGYKILFLDVLFPLDLDKVIFVDADQVVRTDMYELVKHDLQGAPYGFTPMCDSRTEMEGFRFWKQGYWKSFLKGLPYHISALYVVDLKKFREIAAGDRLRGQYHQLSADPESLSNLDQDLPNHMQALLPIHSLPQEWLWCETWCSDESLKDAKTIDLCNNPQTKEPKLDRARRQVPEWTVYDNEIAAVAKRHHESTAGAGTGEPVAGGATDAKNQGAEEGESIQERLQREDAEREKSKHVRDEL
ncbi:glycosyltransferase family 24 protein [Polychaeton citri CBS 116435]|uniref:Glycosyltransferase family 24 protein n=1 Tax=Polychaeton citri CBS 116435 TaxID=1314669 RepID=A0A9P4UQB0_9PEZI|nr:glycosyltransferase family 24 protein [Polychaeton citri CBS 116435]